MAATYTQTGRPLILTTPLGKDVLLAVGLHGTEALSRPYQFTIDAKAARGTAVPFDQLVGNPVAVSLEMPTGPPRYFHGFCVRLAQGESDPDLTDYRLDVVPRVWLLTKKTQSRIFQQITVPDILKKVFAGFDVDYQLTGTFEPRDFCVQYRETDFQFANRLMEEEGIFYYFRHTADKHTMVVANSPQAHPGPGNPILYRSANQRGDTFEDNIVELTKSQEQTSGKVLLWDHTFELPHKKLETIKLIPESVTVGKVNHKLMVGDTSTLEVYDWPGECAQRFDGINPGGGERPADLQKIFADNKRTVELRAQEIAANAVRVRGAGAARSLTAGHKFAVTTLPTDLAATPLQGEGEYVLTAVTHTVHVPANYRTGEADGGGFRYSNTFDALPAGVPFRPTRTAPKPVVSGTQSAVVVGPAGEEIFTDKYGRIKVQFHWDREGKRDADSSCWVRVAHLSAGRAWGAISVPRIGQEVLIDFLEGDPDQPICVGVVYNPDQMPRYTLPDEKTKSYIRTNSSPGGDGYNEVRFEDKAGQEQVYVHAQKDMDERVRNDKRERIGVDRHLRVGFHLPSDHKGDLSGESKKGSQFEEVAIDQHLKVHRHRDEHIGGNLRLLIGGGDGDGTADIHIKNKKTETIDADDDLHVKGEQKQKVDGSVSLTVGQNIQEKAGMKHAVEAGTEIHLKAGTTLVLEASVGVTLKGPGGFITINPVGIFINGTMVFINSGGSPLSGGGASPATPAAAKDAAPQKPKDADHSKTGDKSN